MCTSLPRRRTLCSLIVVGLFAGAATAQNKPDIATGEIRGTISVSASDDVTGEITRGRSLNRYETSGVNTGKQLDPPYALSEKAVIYIESVQGSYEPPRTHPQLDQRDMVFRPLVLPILIGSTVDFPNSDPLFHNVFSLSQPKEFDLGRYPKGQKKSVTFEHTGVVSVYCEIHSYMFATILVLQNPYFAVPDEDGNFILKNIPSGTYQLSFWFGRKKAETKTVTVISNQVTTTNFTY
jgi:plastocyanin